MMPRFLSDAARNVEGSSRSAFLLQALAEMRCGFHTDHLHIRTARGNNGLILRPSGIVTLEVEPGHCVPYDADLVNDSIADGLATPCAWGWDRVEGKLVVLFASLVARILPEAPAESLIAEAGELGVSVAFVGDMPFERPDLTQWEQFPSSVRGGLLETVVRVSPSSDLPELKSGDSVEPVLWVSREAEGTPIAVAGYYVELEGKGHSPAKHDND